MIRRCFHQKKILLYFLFLISFFTFPHTLFAASRTTSTPESGDVVRAEQAAARAPTGVPAEALTPNTQLLKLKKEGSTQPKETGLERLSPGDKAFDRSKKSPSPEYYDRDMRQRPSQSIKQKAPSTSSSKKTTTRNGSKKIEVVIRREAKSRKTPVREGGLNARPEAEERVRELRGGAGWELSLEPSLDVRDRNIGVTPPILAPIITQPPLPTVPVQPPIFVAPQ